MYEYIFSERNRRYLKWKRAVERSMKWDTIETDKGKYSQLLYVEFHINLFKEIVMGIFSFLFPYSITVILQVKWYLCVDCREIDCCDIQA